VNTHFIRPGIVFALLLVFPTSIFATSFPEDYTDQRAILNRAKASVIEIPRQAEVLVRFAWPPEGPTDPVLHAMARDEIVHFGAQGMGALRAAISTVDPIYTADVTAAFIEAKRSSGHGVPGDYLPGLEEAIWFGSIGARRIAIPEITRYDFPPAVLTIIDAIHENPQLARTGIEGLGRMRNPRARFFLLDVLRKGTSRYQRPAAQALGKLGDRGVLVLRQSADSDRKPEREAAMLALLPYTTPDDLTLLHEYPAVHADDDAEVLAAVRERGAELEEFLLEQQATEAATPDEQP